VLAEEVLVPLLDGREMSEIGHAVKARYHRVNFGVLNELDDLLGGKDDIAVNGEPYVVIKFATEGLLVSTAEHIKAERLHA